MAKLVINQEKINDLGEMIKLCPFGAMEEKDGKLEINSACKMCKLCVKKGPEGAVTYVEDQEDLPSCVCTVHRKRNQGRKRRAASLWSRSGILV